MNFRPQFSSRASMIDINVIPLIDVLLVVLIFLTATTTFSKVDDIAVNLPASTVSSSPYEANLLAISQDGQYALNGQLITGVDTSDLQEAFSALQPGEPLIIYADVATPHASVIRALEAAHHSNLTKLSFATQSTP